MYAYKLDILAVIYDAHIYFTKDYEGFIYGGKFRRRILILCDDEYCFLYIFKLNAAIIYIYIYKLFI